MFSISVHERLSPSETSNVSHDFDRPKVWVYSSRPRKLLNTTKLLKPGLAIANRNSLGAAAAISNKDYLTYAGSILTVESRHSSYLRSATKHHPFAQPFDNPLNFNEVYSLAATFIASCPSENEKKPQLALKPFPALALATDGMVKTGDEIILTTPGYILAPSPGQKVYAAFLVVTGPIFLDAIRIEDGKNGSRYQMLIPNGINGQSYAVLTTCVSTPGLVLLKKG